MDSKAIATALEAKYPSKPLHLDSPILAKLEGLMPKHYQAMMAVLIPRVPRVILNEASIPYFEETRKEWYGMSLAEFEKVKGGEDAWVAGMEIFKEIAALLNETKGPYFMGDEVSYADINLVAMFQFYKCAGDDVFDRLMAIDASFPALFKAAGPWLERDGH
ncbi:MAG: hypothetical protein M1834_000112 [Cirrosporium novae-zelandiae]|nr:MAG: hypothetical protein M1834_000112 [Cirrosporium novae-zelandiae]